MKVPGMMRSNISYFYTSSDSYLKDELYYNHYSLDNAYIAKLFNLYN